MLISPDAAARRQQEYERRTADIKEETSLRYTVLAHCDRERAEEEQGSHRFAFMVLHARRRCLNVTEGQNLHQIQSFFVARTFIYPVVEHNCREEDNLCLFL
ncbi:hypothetical protein TNCV_1880731 [Trichonephila clavipes]|nr:hypothetical protein TNCV_1880731 [Trichonephila clavipes]